jgi:alginate O-acetyltransferase complex protein AlgI
MLFNSFTFFIFFPIVTIGYYLLPFTLRWIWLLLASCYFYMAFLPVYILILFFTIIIDYVAGIMIEKTIAHKKKFLVISIIANVGVLAFFKYFNFFNENFKAFSELIGWNYSISALEIILPIGLSFHTFQAMSYTIEVYRGKHKAEKHLGIYALYVMYYPQLVAGPIERPQNILAQLHTKHDFNSIQAISGFRLILWGFFKKLVIADNLATYVNSVYNNPSSFSGLTLLIATIFFAYQIYCDFSGYSDIAIGASRVMGIKLIKNFDRPYSSKSVSEFWKRWHISLSSWFKDYLYIPLGGNRVPISRVYLNLFIVFMVSGLWHGANWTFVVWGALHGVYLIFGMLYKKGTLGSYLKKVDNFDALQVPITFSLVTFAWIFFRANNINDALFIGKSVITNTLTDLVSVFRDSALRAKTFYLNGDRWNFMLMIEMIFVLEILQHAFFVKKDLRDYVMNNTFIRWLGYVSMFVSILFLGKFGLESFIYFQF